MDWAQAIRRLVHAPEELLALSHATTARAEKFHWSANHDRINAVYRRLARQASAASPHELAEPAALLEPVPMQAQVS